MTATVYDFHDIPEAKAKWSDMERFHHLRSLGLAPVLPHQVEMPSDVDPFDSAFYFAPDKDPA
jgi:hypothetical protein